MTVARQDVARLAGILGERSRLAILDALCEGEATVSDLAARLALPQPRVSTHLARLAAAGLVLRRATGRQRAYRTDRARVKPLLDALCRAVPSAARQPSASAARELRQDTPVRRARTCYDHLAGAAGVGLLREMRRRRWLVPETGSGRAYELTAAGVRALGRRGVDMGVARAARRRFTTACLDWTERRPHLGGALGAGVLDALLTRRFVRRQPGRRDVRIVKPLAAWLAGRR